jgi:elongator complex protein 3
MLAPKSNEVRKPSKTMAGVTPVAVMLPPKKCKHGTCLFCPSLNVPQSYTPESPAVLRAKMLNYDAGKQVQSRLEAYEAMHHPTDKIEIIIMGGTFLSYPLSFQYKFIKEIYDALNGRKSKSLNEAKKINQTAKNRCVALCIETRPDVCSQEDITRMLNFGCTRVELGVQAIDNKIYKKVNRGHEVKDVIQATSRLRDAGFKIGYHIMPGIPGSNPKKDISMFQRIFNDSRFKPDQLKIYPCQVIQGSKLEEEYWKGKYKPYSKQTIKELIIKMLKIVPGYCRVMRIMREIPPRFLVAGTTRIDLRKDIEQEIRNKGIKLNEIRFREIGFQKNADNKLELRITKYKASEGDEYFLEVVNNDNVLFGLLRLRIKDKLAIIRELHVYGKSAELGKQAGYQHKGLGKWLMNEAEQIAKKEKANKILVISGVGVREYYMKRGYKLDGAYMLKKL